MTAPRIVVRDAAEAQQVLTATAWAVKCETLTHDGFKKLPSEMRPPADLLAATLPCETCGGEGRIKPKPDRSVHLPHHDLGYVGEPSKPCPACDGSGRPRVQVVTKCEACGGERRLHGPFGRRPHDHCSMFCGAPCPDCTDGRIVHGTVGITKLVPIVPCDREWRNYAHVTAAPGHLMLWVPSASPHGDYVTTDLADQIPHLPPVDTLTDGSWWLAMLTGTPS